MLDPTSEVYKKHRIVDVRTVLAKIPIGRFVEMLRSMQDHTQFVLITHHRKTMEIADRLYGVTMEEPGVSKVLRLDLTH